MDWKLPCVIIIILQWCKVTRYIYLSTVLKYMFEEFVLYLSISKFQYLYFYSTTFQREILLFHILLLHPYKEFPVHIMTNPGIQPK